MDNQQENPRFLEIAGVEVEFYHERAAHFVAIADVLGVIGDPEDLAGVNYAVRNLYNVNQPKNRNNATFRNATPTRKEQELTRYMQEGRDYKTPPRSKRVFVDALGAAKLLSAVQKENDRAERYRAFLRGTFLSEFLPRLIPNVNERGQVQEYIDFATTDTNWPLVNRCALWNDQHRQLAVIEDPYSVDFSTLTPPVVEYWILTSHPRAPIPVDEPNKQGKTRTTVFGFMFHNDRNGTQNKLYLRSNAAMRYREAMEKHKMAQQHPHADEYLITDVYDDDMPHVGEHPLPAVVGDGMPVKKRQHPTTDMDAEPEDDSHKRLARRPDFLPLAASRVMLTLYRNQEQTCVQCSESYLTASKHDALCKLDSKMDDDNTTYYAYSNIMRTPAFLCPLAPAEHCYCAKCLFELFDKRQQQREPLQYPWFCPGCVKAAEDTWYPLSGGEVVALAPKNDPKRTPQVRELEQLYLAALEQRYDSQPALNWIANSSEDQSALLRRLWDSGERYRCTACFIEFVPSSELFGPDVQRHMPVRCPGCTQIVCVLCEQCIQDDMCPCSEVVRTISQQLEGATSPPLFIARLARAVGMLQGISPLNGNASSVIGAYEQVMNILIADDVQQLGDRVSPPAVAPQESRITTLEDFTTHAVAPVVVPLRRSMQFIEPHQLADRQCSKCSITIIASGHNDLCVRLASDAGAWVWYGSRLHSRGTNYGFVCPLMPDKHCYCATCLWDSQGRNADAQVYPWQCPGCIQDNGTHSFYPISGGEILALCRHIRPYRDYSLRQRVRDDEERYIAALTAAATRVPKPQARALSLGGFVLSTADMEEMERVAQMKEEHRVRFLQRVIELQVEQARCVRCPDCHLEQQLNADAVVPHDPHIVLRCHGCAVLYCVECNKSFSHNVNSPVCNYSSDLQALKQDNELASVTPLELVVLARLRHTWRNDVKPRYDFVITRQLVEQCKQLSPTVQRVVAQLCDSST